MTFIRDGFIDVWLYKDCYVKFSTKPFRLDNFHKSIHLTNFAVQKYFMNEADMVPGATENMWSLSQLIAYFESIGKADVWKNKIYDGIKKTLIAVSLASLEATELSTNNFELNGADFMIGFDYEPILLEINSRPALFLSKYQQDMITNRLLEDVVKVVVDRQRDSQASIGDFELIYTHEIPKANVKCSDLSIDCKRIEATSARYKKDSSSSQYQTPSIDVKMNTETLLQFSNNYSFKALYFHEKGEVKK